MIDTYKAADSAAETLLAWLNDRGRRIDTLIDGIRLVEAGMDSVGMTKIIQAQARLDISDPLWALVDYVERLARKAVRADATDALIEDHEEIVAKHVEEMSDAEQDLADMTRERDDAEDARLELQGWIEDLERVVERQDKELVDALEANPTQRADNGE